MTQRPVCYADRPWIALCSGHRSPAAGPPGAIGPWWGTKQTCRHASACERGAVLPSHDADARHQRANVALRTCTAQPRIRPIAHRSAPSFVGCAPGLTGACVRLVAGFAFSQTRRMVRMAGMWLLTWWLLALGTDGRADVVHFRPGPTARGTSRLEGEVLDYTGSELRIRLPDGRERKLSVRYVERIETVRNESQQQGERFFAAGRYEQALAALRRAAAQERRAWVGREILAGEVRCLVELGRWHEATSAFLRLVAQDPQTPYFDCIPLAWRAGRLSRAFRGAAETWMRASAPEVAQLIAASHLLALGPQRRQALLALRRCATSDDARIAWLAKAQQWRADSPSVTAEQVARWELQVEQIPFRLRGGPYYVLGQAWLQHDNPQRAALALMRLPILHSQRPGLVAEALFDAARALEQMDRHDEAARLFAEVVERYAHCPAAAEARQRLKLDNPPTRSDG